ncbi:DNA end-binding protein Ku [Rhizobium azooxidifex]|uniref:Non-homologous end joining protein Ku n=1 Tax=Mycoplana azooxidifex TaxID=1636188 RepID=A0A7W6DG99_9HYPH|nr:Ku protein [Mycoplana azooxidifex]MBB3980070.1 DNA end-binding protein Ku [Mycoplana azooxidifex]
MAQRYYWKGYLKLSLVTCPVIMMPATSESEKVRFHTLNRETGNRVVSQYVDSVSGEPVKEEDEAKGYARGENDYVILTEDDLDRVALDTVKTIDIDKFVQAETIEWVYLEKPHYLMPGDAVGNEAFAVIRDAMKADKVVGVSRVVMGRRERAVILEPRDEGIVLWTLRFGNEIRPEDSYFEDIEKESDPDLVPLVQELIEKKSAHWSPDMVRDPIQTSLLNLIEEKKKTLKPKKSAKGKNSKTEPKSNVINIMDALRSSVDAELKARKTR